MYVYVIILEQRKVLFTSVWALLGSINFILNFSHVYFAARCHAVIVTTATYRQTDVTCVEWQGIEI